MAGLAEELSETEEPQASAEALQPTSKTAANNTFRRTVKKTVGERLLFLPARQKN